MPQQRTLSKTRFVLATECATKLYYTGKADYIDRSKTDTFLQALAEGGFQVGALARLMHPGGTLLDKGTLDERAQATARLLQQDSVVIYEAVIAWKDLLVVVDVLIKKGDRLELREVKAKSYDFAEDGDLRNGRNPGFKSSFLPYLRDVAFQQYVVARAFPSLTVHPYLVFADKSKPATVDGLNGLFRIVRISDGRSEVVVQSGVDRSRLGESILAEVDVQQQVAEIQQGTLRVGADELPFAEAVQRLADAYVNERRIDPVPSRSCGNCEFRAEPDGQRKVGFRECWSQAFGWNERDFGEASVLDLWNYHYARRDARIAEKRLKLKDFSREDIGGPDDERAEGGLSRQGRQALQVAHAVRVASGQPAEIYFDAAGFTTAMKQWSYPLHFIDFETSLVAIPFVRGRRPYEQTAFQFSHHVMHADGRVEHRTQHLDTDVGKFPNYDFVRALREALTGPEEDQGTIFRWHTHENTVLRAVREQLLDGEVHDRGDLIDFIDSITEWKTSKGKTCGPRAMVDLCALSAHFYFDPSTNGSSSLKKVLPALMRESEFLKHRYSQPIYGGGAEMTSLNFSDPVIWWQLKDGQVVDPYSLLPQIFEDLSREDEATLSIALDNELSDGGAAMTAYARLQFTEVSEPVRERIRAALLRYCELDTLAMVMAVQAWQAKVTATELHLATSQATRLELHLP